MQNPNPSKTSNQETIKCATLNINGFKGRYRDSNFYFKAHLTIKNLVKKGFTLCVQEAKLTHTSAFLLKLNMNAHITLEGDGLVTLLPQNAIVINKQLMQGGRVHSTTAMINGVKLSFLNVHAPTRGTKADKIEFLNELNTSIEQTLESNVNTKIILLGDFNINLNSNSLETKTLYEIINRHGLIDSFKHRHPSANGYTRFPTAKQYGNPKRLDAIFVPQHLDKIKWQKSLVTNSDHRLCSAKVSTSIASM